MICPKHSYEHKAGDICPSVVLAKKAARKERREQNKANQEALGLAANGKAPPLIERVSEASFPESVGKSNPVALPRVLRGVGQDRTRSDKKKKRKKKSLFVRLRDALDREVQAYAAERDRDLGCRIRRADKCTGKSELGYHIIPRGKWKVRWDLDFMGIGNIVGACSPCNAGENWHRLTYADYHREIFGHEFYEALWARAHEPVKHTSIELQGLLDLVRKKRRGLEG